MGKVKITSSSTVTRADFARIVGYSVSSVANFISEGLPTSGEDVLLLDGLRWFVDRETRDQDDSKSRLLATKAKLEELKLARELRQTITIEFASEQYSIILTALRSQLLSIPKKVAPLIADGMTAGEREAIVTREIHGAMRELSTLPARLREGSEK